MVLKSKRKEGIQGGNQRILKLTIPEGVCLPRKTCTNYFNGKIDRSGKGESVQGRSQKRESPNAMLAQY